MRGRSIVTIDLVALAVIVALAAALRMATFAGFVGLDDSEYARLAHGVVTGTFSPASYSGPPVFPLRPGIIFPTALAFRILGIGDISITLYPLVLSLLSVILVYMMSRFLFGTLAGVTSALLWAFLPADIMYNATRLLPDLPGAFYASLAVAFLLYVTVVGKVGRLALPFAGVGAGLLFGFSWLCKSSVIFLVPFSAVLFLAALLKMGKKALVLWGGVAAGALAVFLVETALYWKMSGDVLYRFHEIERNYATLKDGFFTEGSRWGWPVGGSYLLALVKRLFFKGPVKMLLNPQLLYLPLVGLVAMAHAAARKDRAFVLPGLWLLTLLAMFNFSTTSLRYYAPLALFDRYLYMLFYPAVILAGGFVSTLLADNECQGEARKERKFWGLLLAMALFFTATYNAAALVRHRGGGWARQARALASRLTPEDRLFTDSLTSRAIEFYWGYPERTALVDFEGLESSYNIPDGSYVFVHKTAINWLQTNSRMWLGKNPVYLKPPFVDSAPPFWKTVWKDGVATLYKVRR